MSPGYLTGLFGQQRQNMAYKNALLYNQMQNQATWMTDLLTSTSINSGATFTINNVNSIVYPSPATAPSKPKPDSNLAWLDERVNEMRVRL